MEGLERAMNRRAEVGGERYVLLTQQVFLKEELCLQKQRVGPGLAELRRSFHHWGTRYDLSPAAVPVQTISYRITIQKRFSDSNWTFYLSLMSSWLSPLSEINLRDVGVVMLFLS